MLFYYMLITYNVQSVFLTYSSFTQTFFDFNIVLHILSIHFLNSAQLFKYFSNINRH